jgi:GTPase SAR1 family protein
MRSNNILLLIGCAGVGKTWVLNSLLKFYKCTETKKIGKFYFHSNDKIIVVGKYDGSTFQGSDRLSMSIMTDLDKFLEYSKNKFVILEGDRFTNSTFINKANPTIIRINGDGSIGRLNRGSEQTERQLKSISTRIKNIELTNWDFQVDSSQKAYELVKLIFKEYDKN